MLLGYKLDESEVYRHQTQKMKWWCPEGHLYVVRWDFLRNGKRCRTCYEETVRGKARLHSTEYVRTQSLKHGWELQDEEYINNITPQNYRCVLAGHIAKMRFGAIMQGAGCKKCYTARQTIYKDPAERLLAVALRKRMSGAIRAEFKKGSAVSDLGCSVAELKLRIESMWKPGMTWDNWGRKPGSWQIDHIKPLARFNLRNREELLQAVHYTNLQPLWFEDNLRKSAKWTE
jgi:hypothetical protein